LLEFTAIPIDGHLMWLSQHFGTKIYQLIL